MFNSDARYSENFTGISFHNSDGTLAYVLSEVLNSSLVALQLAMSGPTWGLDRPTVLPHDLMSLRVPVFGRSDPRLLKAVAAAEAFAAADPDDPARLARLDEAVSDLYELEPDERVLARDSVARVRYFDLREPYRASYPCDTNEH